MTVEALKIVSGLMQQLNIPYAFQVWKNSKPPATYFVGDYNEVPLTTTEESGESESTFFLDGFTRGSLIGLEEKKETIKNALPKRVITESGSAVALFYESAHPIRTGDAEVKRIQLTLRVKEWRN